MGRQTASTAVVAVKSTPPQNPPLTPFPPVYISGRKFLCTGFERELRHIFSGTPATPSVTLPLQKEGKLAQTLHPVQMGQGTPDQVFLVR
jgi:hypothetical protein